MLLFFTLCSLLFVLMITSVTTAAVCGYPGQPAFGRISDPVNITFNSSTSFSEGDIVHYQCNSGYYMKGSDIRRCLPNGLWFGEPPICDTTLSMENMKSTASSSLKHFPPDLAMDGNIRTCFYSNRSPPKWWRLDMITTMKVLSVGISVPFTNTEQSFTVHVIKEDVTTFPLKQGGRQEEGGKNSQERMNSMNENSVNENSMNENSVNKTVSTICSSFSGVFNTQTIVLVCGSGIEGRYLHIEESNNHFDYFGLCEVKIFAEKDKYDCGLIEHPLNAYPLTLPLKNQVISECLNGFKMEGGSPIRSCLRNGSWSGNQVLCKGSVCPPPQLLDHGYFEVNSSMISDSLNSSMISDSLNSSMISDSLNSSMISDSLNSTMISDSLNSTMISDSLNSFAPNGFVNYSCHTGYSLRGSAIQTCSINGSWTGLLPTCHRKLYHLYQ